MTLAKCLYCLTFLFLGEIVQMTDQKMSVQQENQRFVSANVGDRITLSCIYDGHPAWVYWFKQSPGDKPRLISNIYVYDNKTNFYNEFKDNPRFSLGTKNSANHLDILDLQISDSATYYCANSHTFILIFLDSTTVSVRGSGVNVPALVRQSASESVRPGDSVTLNCTVHTGTCDGEHSVYWFKQSEESQPGLIYTQGGRAGQCERKDGTHTHTCVYNLPMESLNGSHAGTFYCAVASCGHILFGDGTKLDFTENDENSPVVVYFLTGALTFTTILVVLMSLSLYQKVKRNNCQGSEPGAGFSDAFAANEEGFGAAGDLHYAAVGLNMPNRSRRQKNTQTECVYSSVKQ